MGICPVKEEESSEFQDSFIEEDKVQESYTPIISDSIQEFNSEMEFSSYQASMSIANKVRLYSLNAKESKMLR